MLTDFRLVAFLESEEDSLVDSLSFFKRRLSCTGLEISTTSRFSILILSCTSIFVLVTLRVGSDVIGAPSIIICVFESFEAGSPPCI